MLNRSVAFEPLVFALVFVLVVWGMGSLGIWDPWELEVAETASSLGGQPSERATLREAMIALAFRALGPGPAAGRLPGVIGALAACAFTYVLIARFVGRRSAVLAVLVLATSPIFLLNARLMVGSGIGFATQAFVGTTAFYACSVRRRRHQAVAIVALPVAIVLSAWSNGVLLGPLPPLAAVCVWSLFTGDTDRRQAAPTGRWVVTLWSFSLVAGVIVAWARAPTGFSFWLGGSPFEGGPPTHEAALEVVFHGFAPWSAVLPIAVLWVLAPRTERQVEAQDLGWVLVLWSAFAYVSWTVFASGFGTPSFLAIVPLAGVIAIAVDEVLERRESRWPWAVALMLMAGLLVRDYGLYPESALRGLAADALLVPEVVHTETAWGILFGVFALTMALMLVTPAPSRPDPTAPGRFLRRTWERGPVYRGWVLLAAMVLGGSLAFGLICIAIDVPLSSVGVRIGRALFAAPFAVLALIYGTPWLRYGFARLGRLRVLPVLVSALLVGAYCAFGLQPALSQHFSPKGLYDTYEALRDGRPERLTSYRSPPTAGRYYASTPVNRIDERERLIDYLESDERVWAIVPAEDLPKLDRDYRRRAGRHLYVADATNARLLLVASQGIGARANQNFIAEHVVSEPPTMKHSVGESFGDRVTLLGYDLDLPNPDSVGAGQPFSITWFWRLTGKRPFEHNVFVHIDGPSQRINGDHIPVDGRYPFELWEKGDVVIDRQALTVPPNFRSGDYPIYVGLFKGGTRIKVEGGENDGAERLQVGVLPVR